MAVKAASRRSRSVEVAYQQRERPPLQLPFDKLGASIGYDASLPSSAAGSATASVSGDTPPSAFGEFQPRLGAVPPYQQQQHLQHKSSRRRQW